MPKYDASFSVNRLVEALMEEECPNISRKRQKGYRKESNGIELHKKLGFENEEIYERYFEHDGKVYRIYGSPDRLDRKERVVEELKTYRLVENYHIQRMRGIYQLEIYCYLVEYELARLYIYNVPEARYVEILNLVISKRKQIETIRKAIEKILEKKGSK